MKHKLYTCCFTGHRKIPSNEYEEILQQLVKTIVRLIKNGYRFFGTGGALGFDTIAAQTVLYLKNFYPHIRLILVLPCLSQTKGWKEKDIDEYERIKNSADKVVYTSQEYTQGCMLKRNRHLVDYSSVCICYLTKQSGGTSYTVKYAQQNGLKIFNIADMF